MKTYHINTMQDIFDTVTEENFERFMADLRNIIESAVLLKNLTKRPITNGYEWIDDGKQDCDISISISISIKCSDCAHLHKYCTDCDDYDLFTPKNEQIWTNTLKKL